MRGHTPVGVAEPPSPAVGVHTPRVRHAQPVAAEPTDSGNGNVLIVEDDPRGGSAAGSPPARRRLPGHRGGVGQRCDRSHRTGAAGYRAVRCLPARNGRHRIHSPPCRLQERTANLPIALITSSDDSQILARGLDAGADDFLSKPVNALELRTRVRSLLGRARCWPTSCTVRGQAGPSPSAGTAVGDNAGGAIQQRTAAGAADRRRAQGVRRLTGSLPVGFRVSHAAPLTARPRVWTWPANATRT